MIDRIETFVTELPVRLRRIFSSGSHDTGGPRDLLGKPVLVKLHADGVVGIGQIRPISPGPDAEEVQWEARAALIGLTG